MPRQVPANDIVDNVRRGLLSVKCSYRMRSMKIENQEQQRKELEESCASMAKVIGDSLPEGVGFALIFSDFGNKGNVAYCSNVQREGMIKLLRETANRIDGVSN